MGYGINIYNIYSNKIQIYEIIYYIRIYHQKYDHLFPLNLNSN
jgi:hypothetical protein